MLVRDRVTKYQLNRFANLECVRTKSTFIIVFGRYEISFCFILYVAPVWDSQLYRSGTVESTTCHHWKSSLPNQWKADTVIEWCWGKKDESMTWQEQEQESSKKGQPQPLDVHVAPTEKVPQTMWKTNRQAGVWMSRKRFVVAFLRPLLCVSPTWEMPSLADLALPSFFCAVLFFGVGEA